MTTSPRNAQDSAQSGRWHRSPALRVTFAVHAAGALTLAKGGAAAEAFAVHRGDHRLRTPHALGLALR